MDDTTFGERLGSIRRRRGLTQQELASRSRVSYSLIRQIERGERETTRLETVRKLAVPLGVTTSTLMAGDGTDALPDTVQDWTPVRDALFAAPDTTGDTPPTSATVRATIAELRPLTEESRYAEAAAMLPALLRDAKALDGGADARAARSAALQFTGLLLVQTRQWDAAEVALRLAADAAGSQADETAAADIQSWMLLRQGRLTEVRKLSTSLADSIEPKLSKATDIELALWGRMLFRVAATAVRDNRPDLCEDALDLAAVAAARIGREIHADASTWFAFGPATVLMLRAESAVMVEQPDKALTLIRHIQPDTEFSPLSASRCRHRLDVASALAQLHRYPQALTVLDGLRHDTPQWLVQQQYARDIMTRIVGRRRTLTPEMRETADFLRVPY